MKFNSGKEMYDYLQNSGDLYCQEEEIYVFMYNEAGALCYYYVSKDEAKALSLQSKEMDDYWGAFLGTGGCILDEEELEYSIQPSFDFCNEQFDKDWVSTSEYC